MQQLKDVTLTAIALVDDPAVPKAYFRVVKRNLNTQETSESISDVTKDAYSVSPDGTIDLTPIYAELTAISQKIEAHISQISTVITDLQSQVAAVSTAVTDLQSQQVQSDTQSTTGDLGWMDTLTYLQSSYQNGEIDDIAYDALLGELEQGLSQLRYE